MIYYHIQLSLYSTVSVRDSNSIQLSNPEQVQMQFRIKINSPQMELILNRSAYVFNWVITAIVCSVINGIIRYSRTIVRVMTADLILPLLPA